MPSAIQKWGEILRTQNLSSLDAKMKLYASKPIRGIAFWRISQEPVGFWDHLVKELPGSP